MSAPKAEGSAGSTIARLRMVVVPPSTSLRRRLTRGTRDERLRPGRVVPSCLGRIVVAAGFVMVHSPLVAVSVPGVALPAAVDLEVVEQGAAVRAHVVDCRARRTGSRHGRSGAGSRPCCAPSGRDLRVVGVVVPPDGRLLGRVELEGEAEDPVGRVQPVDLVAVGDVQVRRLLGRVAVLRAMARPRATNVLWSRVVMSGGTLVFV